MAGTLGPPVGSPISGVQLRCQSCGAPYPEGAQGEILTCVYCGTSQRVVDARQFLDHFMAQVTAFVRQAVPLNIDVSRAEHVDPVARLAAFNSSVRPRLVTESEQYRFSCFNLLSGPLAALPFSPAPPASASVDPASVSVFAAKVQSVGGLAVDGPSRDLLLRAGGLASAYQSLLVAVRLMAGTLPERFHLLDQNFAVASEAIKGTGGWPALVSRMTGLGLECRAIDTWLTSGKPQEAGKTLRLAQHEVEQARKLFATSPDLGYMLPAVDQELATVRTVNAMLDIAEQSPTTRPDPLLFVQRLSNVLDWLGQHAPGEWAPRFRSGKLREEVFVRASQLRAAQSGRGAVRVSRSGAGPLVPFWAVELPYTFETGALWTKHGKEVSETLLVAATFPTDLHSLSGPGAAQVLTDVFSAGPGGHLMDQYYNRLRGKEQKISDSGPLIQVLQHAVMAPVTGEPAIPPFTSEAEALRLVQAYLDAIRVANPKTAGQLRASSPRVLDLVYFPCSLTASPPLAWLGRLSPSSLGAPESLQGFLS